MAKLYFKVGSDWEEVVKLRNEIAKLKQELKGMDSTQSPAAFKTLNTQLAASTQRMDELVTNAAKAGATMENDFRKKIFDASQTVNGLSESITIQRGTIQKLKNELSGLKEKYREALKQDGDTSSLEAKIKSTSAKLREQKDTLFSLTQEQANARLSVKKLRDEYELYNSDGKHVVATNESIAVSWKKALAVIGGTAALKKLGSEIIRVRGEFQSMQTAIETMIGKDIAGKLIPQIKELAKISPLTMSDMVGAEKMMLGFNIQAEDTIKYLKAISDISMGESGKFNSLTLAFSQMSAAGKLMGQDLNQMINAGFNPLQIISEKTGKSIATLKEEMSKGAISAEMVQQAFIDATSAGGKFFGMSENASKTINGQISMMQDALDNAFNEMGQKSEGVIMKGIQMTTSLIENYETVGKVLTGLVATYGAYRAAVMLVTAAESKHTLVEIGLTNVRILARKAQLALNAAMLTNPYVLLATAVVGLGAAMWAFHDSATAAEKAQKRFNEQKEETIKKEQKHKQRLEELVSAIQNEYTSSMDRVKAMKAIKDEYPALFQKYIDEKGHIKDLIALWKEYNEEVGKEKVKENKSNYSNSQKLIGEYEQVIGLWKRFGEDPNFHKNSLNESEKQLADKYKNETLSTLKSKLDEEKKILASYQKEVRSDELAQWQLDLKKNTDAQVKSELNEMKRLQQARKNNKRYSLNVGVGSLKGATTESELQNRIDILESELTSRNPNSETKNKKYWEDKKKEAEAARDALDVSEKNSKKWNEYTQQIRAAQAQIDKYSNPTKQEDQSEKLRKEQEKLNEQLLSMRRKNQQDEINLMKDGTEKKLKQIEFDYQKQIDAIKKQENEWSKTNGGRLTDKQAQEISEAYANAESQRDKNIADVNKEELKAEQQALNDYLKEYGTFQQQKLAIAQEYAEKIRKAEEESGPNSAQVSLLEKQRDVAIQNKETEVIKANIDWVTVFGEFGGMFNDMIKPALEEAKKYIQTDKFKNSDQASQKSLIDAISQMEKSLGGAGGVNFKKLGQDVKAYQIAEQNRICAVENEIAALDKLKKAQEDYAKAQKDGTEGEKQVAKDALDIAQQNADIASANVRTQTDIANQTQQNLTNTATGLKASMENLLGGLQQISSGGLYNTYSGIIKTVNGFKDVIGKTSESLKEVPIVGWILSIIDVLKDGLSNLVGGLLDAVLNAVSGIISDVLSGDLFVTIGKSLRDGIGNILNAISFGGFNSLFGIGGNRKEVEEAINRLTDRNEILGKSIDKLTDVMEKEAGSKSISAYNQASEYQKEQNANTLQIAREQARYSGSHHSWQYYMGWTNEQIQWARKNVDKNFSGTDSLWGLTPEQMKMLLSNADIYEQISGAGKGGYGNRVMEKLEAYAENAGKLEELTDKINESLMQVSFDGLRDSFLDSLMDMNKDAKSFSEDFSEYMQRALLNFSIGEMFDEDLKEWYTGIAELMKEQQGKLTEDQLNAARQDYDDMVQKAMEERNKIAALTGYTGNAESTSQSSTSRGFGTEMTHEDAGELSGRFTALQIAGEEIKNQSVIQAQSLNLLTMKADDILRVNTEVRNIADDTRDLIANSYLELVQISENTGAIVKPIQQMQRDIAEVKNNTSKL